MYLVFSEIVTVMIKWWQDLVSSNSICNQTRDEKSDTRFAVVRFCLSLVWLQTELDSTQSYYHY